MMSTDNARWFQHDCNARKDLKLKKVLKSEYADKGIRVWWFFCEYMGQKGKKYKYKFDITDKDILDDIAEEVYAEKEWLLKFFDDCVHKFTDLNDKGEITTLLQSDGRYIWSNRFIEDIANYDAMVEKRRMAGKLSHKPKTDEQDNTKPEAFATFEANWGVPLYQAASEKIKVWIEDYTEDWVIKAINEAALQGKRNLAYVEAILRNSKDRGVPPGTPREDKKQPPALEQVRPRLKTAQEVMRERGQI
jgi:DnaD/phage-associated family protein